MITRRRPLLRAAALGGAAYIAGRRAARRSAEAAQAEACLGERISELARQRQAGDVSDAPSPAAGVPGSMAEQVNQLAVLHDHGTLTDDEFAAAKAKLLGI